MIEKSYNVLTKLFTKIYTRKYKKRLLKQKINDLYVKNNILQLVREYSRIIARMPNMLHTKNNYNIK